MLTSNLSAQLHLKTGAYTDIADLIRIRHAAKHIQTLNKNKTSNPLSGLLRSQARGRGIDFAEVRHYQPGDDVRTIDWRVTARTQVPHTKLFQEEKERPVLILTDQSQAMFFGSETSFKSVIAAQTAALIAWISLQRGDRVGGIVFSDDRHREVRPRRNKRAVLRLLNELNDFNHRLNRDHRVTQRPYLLESLLEIRRVAKHGCTIFVISDFNQLDQDVLRHLRHLSRHNDLVAIHISDALEQHLPDPDLYQITNGQDRMQINTIGNKTRKEYAQRFENRLSTVKLEFQKLKSTFISLTTRDNPIDVLAQFERRSQ